MAQPNFSLVHQLFGDEFVNSGVKETVSLMIHQSDSTVVAAGGNNGSTRPDTRETSAGAVRCDGATRGDAASMVVSNAVSREL